MRVTPGGASLSQYLLRFEQSVRWAAVTLSRKLRVLTEPADEDPRQVGMDLDQIDALNSGGDVATDFVAGAGFIHGPCRQLAADSSDS